MLQLSTSGENLPIMVDVKDRSFHMDRGKIVCNGCGGHFPNLVLFENHTHTDSETNQYANKPSRKSGPKTLHKTFDTITHEEMMRDFHKMPELEGCYYRNDKFHCCICGKGFKNPYVLFSHRIVHPADMMPAYPKPASIKTQTPKVRYYLKKSKNIKVMFPEQKDSFREERKEVSKGIQGAADNHSDSDENLEQEEGYSESEEGYVVSKITGSMPEEVSESEDDSQVGPRVSKAKLSRNDDEVDAALPIRFKKNQEMIQVPWVPFKKLTSKRNMTKTKGSRTYVYRMLGNKSELYTPVVSDIDKTASNVVMVSPRERRNSSEEELEMEKIAANPYGDKGLLFTDFDSEKRKKVFSRLPGLEKCRIMKDGQFQCDKCFKIEANPYILFTHRLINHEVKDKDDSSETSQTNLVFYSLPGLNRCTVKNGNYYCDLCEEKFANPYLLFTHKISHDSDSTEPTNVLKLKENSDFGSIFGEDGLANIKVKYGKYYCDKCPLYYSNPYLLLNHKLLHKKTDAKIQDKQVAVSMTTSCQQTEESDSERESVDGELEMVFQKREPEEDICYECNICELQFETLDGLSLHIESHGATKAEVDDDFINENIESSYNTGEKRNIPVEGDKSLLPSTTKKIKTERVELYPGETTVVSKAKETTTEGSDDWIAGYTAANSALWEAQVKTEPPEEQEGSKVIFSANTTARNALSIKEIKLERKVTPANFSGERTLDKFDLGLISVSSSSAPPNTNFVPQPHKIKVKIKVRPHEHADTKEAMNVKTEKNVDAKKASIPSHSTWPSPKPDQKVFNAVVRLQRVNIKPGQRVTISKG